jgi:catechol 2,3-dioxygenase-like lactoylglutathione lyase family enzyme
MRIDYIDHLVLTVKNIETSSNFYSKVLGMESVTFGAGRKALAFENPTPGSADLCFITTVAIAEVVNHLDSCGVKVIEGPVHRTGATGPILSVYFRDPDSNLIEIANYV